jgi:coenzyme F420-dependent glucose-6-phosphate dehydrogenase
MNYWVQLATEQFPPSALVDQAVEAERAGFDAVNVSDHYQPWWEPGHSGQAWTLLGAICHATERVGVGTGVTAPVHRDAAGVAARLGDGLWTLADPESAPDLIDAYRGACEDAGKEAGEIILQTGFSWAGDDDSALEGARVWKGTQPPEYFTDDWHDPKAMFEKADREVSDDEFKESYIISSDPEHHVERIREIEAMGATVVCLQNGSGADPLGALRTYRDKVLPALKGARVG